MRFKRLFSTELVVIASCLVLTGCARSPSTSTTDVSRNQTPVKNTSESTSGSANNASTDTGHSPSTLTSWPKISIQRIGNLPSGVEGNTLTMSTAGPVSVGGYTGTASITGVYRLLPHPVQIGRLPARTHDAAAAYLNGNLYVFGGGQATSYNSIVRVRSGLGRITGHLSSPLSDAAAIPLQWQGNQAIAVIGGYDGSVYRTHANVFSKVDGRLIEKPLFRMQTPVRYPAIATERGHVYIVGGKDTKGPTQAVYMWSQKTGLTSTSIKLQQSLEKAAAFVSGNFLIVAGGETTTGQPQQSVTAYNLKTGAAKVIGRLPTPLADMGYIQDKNLAYLAGGITSTSSHPVRSIWKLVLQ